MKYLPYKILSYSQNSTYSTSGMTSQIESDITEIVANRHPSMLMITYRAKMVASIIIEAKKKPITMQKKY